MKNKLTILTKYLLDFMFFGGIIVCATLPLTLKFYSKYSTYFKNYYIQMCILFGVSGIFAVLIVRELRKVFKTVIEDNCFVKENVKSLDRMGIYSVFIAITSTLRALIYVTPGVLVVILVFVIAGLFSKILAQVFDKAVTYKIENDLTI